MSLWFLLGSVLFVVVVALLWPLLRKYSSGEAGANRTALAAVAPLAHQPDLGVLPGLLLDQLGGAVGAAVVDHDDLEVPRLGPAVLDDGLEVSLDDILLVEGGDDDRNEHRSAEDWLRSGPSAEKAGADGHRGALRTLKERSSRVRTTEATASPDYS